MAIDLESLGLTGGTSVITSLLSWLGIKNKMEKDIEARVTMEACRKQHEREQAELDDLKDDVKYIRGRIDRIFDFLLNGSMIKGNHDK